MLLNVGSLETKKLIFAEQGFQYVISIKYKINVPVTIKCAVYSLRYTPCLILVVLGQLVLMYLDINTDATLNMRNDLA